MTMTGDPFPQSWPEQRPTWPPPPGNETPYPTTEPRYNTLAVLSPVFAVVLPPAGAILGHWALVQMRRTGEQGRTPAIWGLILGYLLTAALILGLILWAVSSYAGSSGQVVPGTVVTAAPFPQDLPPVVVTSVAPAPNKPRIKLDLAKVTVGTCAEIQKRDVGDDALDLFGVACEHRQGVYTVVARVTDENGCQSTYIAAPPDHSFALCLNEF